MKFDFLFSIKKNINFAGLFSDSSLPYHLESEGSKTPTLSEMTQAAIKMLQKEAYGYVLLVEGIITLYDIFRNYVLLISVPSTKWALATIV